MNRKDDTLPPDQTSMIPELRQTAKPGPPPGSCLHSTGLAPELFREEELAGDSSQIDLEQESGPRMALESGGERYHMKRTLATGGFGKIFLAEDRLLGREMVIKSLKTDFLQAPAVRKHFIDEAKLCARLNHPAIVPIYSLHTDSIHGLHIAMQRVNGITLQLYLERFRDYLQNHRLSAGAYQKFLKERLELFIRICDAISYCHERNVIHNDLKPSNIMIGNFNQVYVMDWGAASADNAVSKGDLQGTCAYLAPEKTATRTATRKTDIFALGMVLNEIVTLRGPIRADHVSQVLERICTGNFEPSTCVFPQYRIPETLRAIIEKARCPRPAERYDTVRQLADDIRHYLFYEKVSACPDTPFQRWKRLCFRHQRTVLSAILLLILLFTGLQFWSYYRRNELAAILRTEMFDNLRLQTETDHLAGRLNQELALLQGQLRSLGSVFLHEMENAKSKTPFPAVPEAADLAPGAAHPPPGMIHTAFYRYPITLDSGVHYRLSPAGNGREKQAADRVFQSMHSQLLNTMFINSTSGKSNLCNDRRKIFHLQECLIRRMIFLVGDHSAYCFPGMYGTEQSAEDFLPDPVRRAFRSRSHLFWSPVYRDSSGNPVLACWLPILNRRGMLSARLGFEVSYTGLMQPVLDQAKQERHHSIYAIVDQEDRVIYSTVTHRRKWKENQLGTGRDALQAELFYRFPHLLRKIRKPDAPAHFTEELNGWDCRIYWSKLPVTGWILIRHVAEGPVGKR